MESLVCSSFGNVVVVNAWLTFINIDKITRNQQHLQMCFKHSPDTLFRLLHSRGIFKWLPWLDDFFSKCYSRSRSVQQLCTKPMQHSNDHHVARVYNVNCFCCMFLLRYMSNMSIVPMCLLRKDAFHDDAEPSHHFS